MLRVALCSGTSRFVQSAEMRVRAWNVSGVNEGWVTDLLQVGQSLDEHLHGHVLVVRKQMILRSRARIVDE